MQSKMSIPFQGNYNKIWQNYKISFFSSYSLETWKEELINNPHLFKTKIIGLRS